MATIIEVIRDKVNVDFELETAIQSLFKREVLNNKQEILTNGQCCKKLYFLKSGTVRTFYFHEDKEVTSWFYKEGLFFTSLVQFLHAK